MTTYQEAEIYILIGIIAAIFGFLLLIKLGFVINSFSRELNYLNIEIKRTEGSERKYWLRKRRRLWLSLIPFVKY